MQTGKPLFKRVVAAVAVLTCTTACLSACGLYGPPPDENETATDISFSPETNSAECVYGPPEYFIDSE